jgi:hypothetical protein
MAGTGASLVFYRKLEVMNKNVNSSEENSKWWELQMKRSDVPQKYEYLEQSEY